MALRGPVDIAPLIYFRVLGGLLMTVEIAGELFNHYWVDLTRSQFHFSYPGFEWVDPWPVAGLGIHYAITIAAGLCVTVGWHYRASAIVFCVGSTWLFLMDKSLYINHHYLYCLIALILVFLPAHRAVSFDARRDPTIASATAPAWCRWILLFQIAVVYGFAGVAKLDADWFAGMPMRIWLAARADYLLIGGLLGEPWLPLLISRGGLVFDLLIVPAMLWRRTRRVAFAFAVLFHLTNVSIFGIGTFPWFSLMATALFFSPAAFRRLPLLRTRLPASGSIAAGTATDLRRRMTASVLIAYVMIQLVVPLRHFLYPQPTRWTEAGHTFSWRMMLRSKRGIVVYSVRDPTTDRSWTEKPRDYLTRHQARDMVGKPEMIVEFARFLADEYERNGIADVEVRANCTVSLNGRPFQPYVKPGVDLAEDGRERFPYDWIVPLREE